MFGVLPTGMALVSIIDAGVGFLGYAKYGQSVEGSITLNLPHNVFFTGIKLVFTLTAFFNFVIQQYVIVDTLLPKLQARLEHRERGLPVKWHLPMEMAFRAGLVVLAATISVLIPNLEEIIPLVGFTAGMMIAFIFPPLFHWVVFTPLIQRGEHPGNVVVEAVKNSLMISVGAFGIFVGLYQTFRSRIS
ncbi:transmembrane amino acid transporter protein [Ditylenchus destructor]|nr:transmembrane amino acid transporter protein [Ditylenchus destructor]